MASQPRDENKQRVRVDWHSPGPERRNTEQRSLDDEQGVVQNTRSRSKLTDNVKLGTSAMSRAIGDEDIGGENVALRQV